jgi:hypothetical protein
MGFMRVWRDHGGVSSLKPHISTPILPEKKKLTVSLLSPSGENTVGAEKHL